MKKLMILLIAALVLVLVPVACSRAPAPPPMPTPIPTPTPAPRPPSLPGGSDSGTLQLTDQERLIVRTGDMSLIVKDVLSVRDSIAQLAARFEGYVVSSQLIGEEEGMRGFITIRVPANRFDQSLSEIRTLAVRVISETANSQDVTEEYTDLQSRLRNAEATEKQYLALLEKATNVEDILKIYDSLSRVRSEIEQLKGRIQYLERTASMSSISVQLKPETTAKPVVRPGWSGWEVLKSAARGFVAFLQVLGTIIIWLIIFIPVWGTVTGILLWRRHRRKKKTTP